MNHNEALFKSVFMGAGVFDILDGPAIIVFIFGAFFFCHFYTIRFFLAFELTAPRILVVKVAVNAHATASEIAFHFLTPLMIAEKSLCLICDKFNCHYLIIPNHPEFVKI